MFFLTVSTTKTWPNFTSLISHQPQELKLGDYNKRGSAVLFLSPAFFFFFCAVFRKCVFLWSHGRYASWFWGLQNRKRVMSAFYYTYRTHLHQSLSSLCSSSRHWEILHMGAVFITLSVYITLICYLLLDLLCDFTLQKRKFLLNGSASWFHQSQCLYGKK